MIKSIIVRFIDRVIDFIFNNNKFNKLITATAKLKALNIKILKII
jgi:hypothetical protein